MQATPTREQLLLALEDDMLAHHMPFARLPTSIIHAEGDCLCYESPISFGAYGGVLAQHFEATKADERIRELNAILKASDKDIGWVLSPIAEPSDLAQRLEGLGLRKLVDLTGMALDFKELAEPPPSRQIELRKVDTEDAVRDYARLYPLLFNVPLETWIEPLIEAEVHLFNTGATHWNRWLAYLDGKPVSAARTGQKDGIAGLQVLCTLPEYRDQGIGQTLATHALRQERCDWGIVWAGPTADRLYSRMGYRKITSTSVYV
jgi:GNAT superfamily N-acetyltransferase